MVREVCFLILKKKEILNNLEIQELELANKIKDLEYKNLLLSDNLDLDYIETLIRKKFLYGKKNESLYIINKYDN